MSNDSLTVNCLVLGNKPPSDYVCPVNIPWNKTISHLQTAIKAECKGPTLDVDKDLLCIWKVSIAIDDTFDAKMADFQPSYENDSHTLLPTTELSDCFFRDFNQEHLHIVVQPPDDGEIKLPYILILNVEFFRAFPERLRLKQCRLRSLPPEPPRKCGRSRMFLT
jgi:hypothetical protein